MIYYHIQELSNGKPEWKTGEQYEILESNHNWFYKLLINGLGDKKYTDENKEIGLVKYIDSQQYKDIENKYSENEINYKYSFLQTNIEILKNSLKQNLKWIQEEVFENIRKSEYPELPTRKSCIWVCDKEHLEKWWNLFCSKDNRFVKYKRKILELKLEGKFHKADGRLIDSDSYKIEDFEERARKYWEGNFHSEDEFEILFLGKAVVTNEFSDFDDFYTKSKS